MSQRQMGIASALVVVVLGLSGCGDKEPAPSATETANVRVLSATAEPSRERVVAEPLDRPAGVDDPGKAGALAMAEYFYRLTVYAAASGDTTELEMVSGEGCKSCSDYVAQVKSFYDGGGYWTSMPEAVIYDSAIYRYVNDGEQLEEEPNQYVIVLDIKRGSYQYVNGDGELGSSSTQSKIVAFLVTYSDGWVIDGVKNLPKATSVDSIHFKEQ